MEGLRISLLGPFQVIGNGEPITDFEADSARALLAYLAMHAGIAFPRTTLAALLWPEQPETDALHALRQALNRLRKAIGDQEADPPFLTITRTTIQFNPDSRYWLDVTAFNDLIAACKQHPHRRLEACRSCRRRLAQAAELYRGDLLAGFFWNSTPFEEWLLLERESLHRQAIAALYHLAACHEQREEWDAVLRYARQQVALEPWQEEAHRQLMRALAMSGQRSAALAQYQTCCRILETELGVAPAAATEMLREQIETESLVPHPRPRHNLPTQLTPFIGREAELEQIAERLNHPDCRLVTLVGLGGVGKTRLALQVAREDSCTFPNGVYFVPLTAIHSADALATALVRGLEIYPSSGESLTTQLLNYLKGKDMLLVLDNLEHLTSGNELIVDLLQKTTDVCILVTSQSPLNVPGEWLFTVKALDCPEENAAADEHYSAVHFFCENAVRRQPDFVLTSENWPHVARICRLLGGIPLALELAAGWLRTRSCQEIAQEIQNDLDFLRTSSPGVPGRHRSIRAAFDYSWALLTAEEQAALRRLAVFPAGFDREAAWHVAGASPEVVDSLVNRSLLQPVTYSSPNPVTRYSMHRLLHRYAMERLVGEPADAFDAHRRHCDYYIALLESLKGDLEGRSPRRALETFGRESDNIRAAWDWAVAQEDVPRIERALGGLIQCYVLRGWFKEGEAILGHAAEALSGSTPVREDIRHAIHKLAVHRSVFLGHLGRYDEAATLLQSSLEGLQASDDAAAIVRCLNTLSWIHSRQGNYAQAQELATWALTLAQAGHLRSLEADSLNNLGSVCFYRVDFDKAQEYYTRSLDIRRELGDRWGESVALGNLGIVAYEQNRFPTARAYLAQALEIVRCDVGVPEKEAWYLSSLGMTALDSGDYAASLDYCQQAPRLRRETGELWGTSNTLSNLGYTYWCLGDFTRSGECYTESIQVKGEIGDRRGGSLTAALYGLLLHSLERDAEALQVGMDALAVAEELGSSQVEAYALTCIGHAQVGLGRLHEADAAYRRALDIRRELGQQSMAVEILARLAHLALMQDDLPQAQSHVNEILRYLEDGSLDGALEPFLVYLTCYRVLQANGRPEARAVLATAYQALQAHAERIPDRELRHSFLTRVAAHAQIVQE